MTKRFLLPLILGFLLFVFSCSTNDNKSSNVQADSTTTVQDKSAKQELYSQIMELEKEIFDTTKSINRGVAINLMVLYARYAHDYPNDSVSPEFLYKAAEVARGAGDGRNAIRYYKLLLDKYPDYSKRAISLFMTAFTYENLLNDTANARKYYERFIKEYPEHEFADDARQLLKFLGKSPDEIVKSFKK
jgi:tetratricopeptide (TPR) repeat protein